MTKLFAFLLPLITLLTTLFSSPILPSDKNEAYIHLEGLNSSLSSLKFNNGEMYFQGPYISYFDRDIFAETNAINVNYGENIDNLDKEIFTYLKDDQDEINLNVLNYKNGNKDNLIKGNYPTGYSDIALSKDLLKYLDDNDEVVPMIKFDDPELKGYHGFPMRVVGVVTGEKSIMFSPLFYLSSGNDQFENEYGFLKTIDFYLVEAIDNYHDKLKKIKIDTIFSRQQRLYKPLIKVDIEDLENFDIENLEIMTVFKKNKYELFEDFDIEIDYDPSTPRKNIEINIDSATCNKLRMIEASEMNVIFSYDDLNMLKTDYKYLKSLKAFGSDETLYNVEILNTYLKSNSVNTIAVIIMTSINLISTLAIAFYLNMKLVLNNDDGVIKSSLFSLVAAFISLIVSVILIPFYSVKQMAFIFTGLALELVLMGAILITRQVKHILKDKDDK